MNGHRTKLRAKLQMGLAALSVLGLSATTAVATSIVLAPPAIAQKAPKPPKPKKEFVEPFNAALKALQAKDFATALAQADLAMPHAQTPQERFNVEQIRTPALANLKDTVKLAASMEAQIASGLATPDALKQLKSLLGAVYTEAGDQAKAFTATKAYVDEYGGNAQQYAYLMSVCVRDKNYPDAQKYGQKALSQARTEGKVPEERWHGLLLRAYLDGGDVTGYLNGLEAAYADYPKQDYLRAIAQEAEKAPKFNRKIIGLDVYRALAAAGVTLSDREKLSMANSAVEKALPIEAETVLKAMSDAGTLGKPGDPDADAQRKLYASAQVAAKGERTGGLASSEKLSNQSATGSTAVLTGEAYIGAGDYAKAISLIQSGLGKGGLSDGEAALAKLHLGMAQLKSGDKEGAKATLSGIKADNGASEIARLWLIAAKK